MVVAITATTIATGKMIEPIIIGTGTTTNKREASGEDQDLPSSRGGTMKKEIQISEEIPTKALTNPGKFSPCPSNI